MSVDTTVQPTELDAGLEQELRSAINPKYEDVRGTESYERKRLLGEIDRLRNRVTQQSGALATSENGEVAQLHAASGMLPCPFCGTTPDEDDPNTFVETQGTKWGAVTCGCGAMGPDVRTGYEPWLKWKFSAIKEWNTRALKGNRNGTTSRI